MKYVVSRVAGEEIEHEPSRHISKIVTPLTIPVGVVNAVSFEHARQKARLLFPEHLADAKDNQIQVTEV